MHRTRVGPWQAEYKHGDFPKRKYRKVELDEAIPHFRGRLTDWPAVQARKRWKKSKKYRIERFRRSRARELRPHNRRDRITGSSFRGVAPIWMAQAYHAIMLVGETWGESYFWKKQPRLMLEYRTILLVAIDWYLRPSPKRCNWNIPAIGHAPIKKPITPEARWRKAAPGRLQRALKAIEKVGKLWGPKYWWSKQTRFMEKYKKKLFWIVRQYVKGQVRLEDSE